MTPNPCTCGGTPTFLTCHDSLPVLLQLACKCGKAGAVLRYVAADQKPVAVQSAIDGWNLHHPAILAA